MVSIFNHNKIYAELSRTVNTHISGTGIRTINALMVRMAGDLVAGTMAHHIVYWLQYSQSGAVYKSAADWGAECGLSAHQVKRVHQNKLLDKMGIGSEVRSTKWGRVRHYWIEAEPFAAGIAAVFEVAIDRIKSILAAVFGRKGSDGKRPMGQAKSAQPVRRKAPDGSGGKRPMGQAESARLQYIHI